MLKRREYMISIILFIMLFFLNYFYRLYEKTGWLSFMGVSLVIIGSSMLIAKKETKLDLAHQAQRINYDNLDVAKYISSIVIIILHLRPFQEISPSLDLLFNNMISRICVPLFFVITGYFVAKKDKENPKYIKKYVYGMIPMYLIWSLIYVPIGLTAIKTYLPAEFTMLHLSNLTPIMWVLVTIFFIPVLLIIVLFYSGTYYHLWYFPATFISLFILYFWKKKFDIRILLVISFVLFLFGATETYYGFFTPNLQHWLSTYYYDIFITSRNFLFFGLFYIVLGFYMGSKKDLYVSYSFLGTLSCFILLVCETLFLQPSQRLDSNILLSCAPLVYFLFINLIYSKPIYKKKLNYSFRGLSKYYYLIHPLIIILYTFIMSYLKINILDHYVVSIVCVIGMIHLVSILLIKLSRKYPKFIL